MNTPSFQIDGHTKLIALFGSPVAHSISPLMHNAAFRELGLEYVYLCFDVKEDSLKYAVDGLKACGGAGFNLTFPVKNKIMEMLDEVSPAAEIIGAVNTVVIRDGRLTGYNTDGTGFMRSAGEQGISVAGKTVTILGAGGAATAISTQAALDGAAALRIFARPSSRFHDRTVRLVDTINRITSCRAELIDLNDRSALKRSIAESVLLINGTSVGMIPDTDASLITDPSFFYPELAVGDVIYEPRRTRFLETAAACGCKTFNGMYMLLYQGAEGFRLWTGHDMPVDSIKAQFFS